VPGVSAGVGVHHQSRSFTSISNTVVLPAYTRADAAVFVRLGERLDAQVNIENLFNTGYFPVAHNDNNISTGAPRNARLTLTARF
jgi:catecholate siderophore receptor